MKKSLKTFCLFLVIVFCLVTISFADTYEAPNVIIGPASYEPNMIIIDDVNFTMEEVVKVMSQEDGLKLVRFVSEYRKGNREVYNDLLSLVAKYNIKDAKTIVDYILKDSTVKILAGYSIDHSTNKLKYHKIDNVTVKNNKDIEKYGEVAWKKIIDNVPKDFYDNIDFIFLEQNKGYDSAINLCALDEMANRWCLYMDIELLGDTSKSELIKNLIYATVYYYILKNDQVEFDNVKKNTYSYKGKYYKEHSYINIFYKRFWKDKFKEINKSQKLEYPTAFFDDKSSKTAYDDMAVSFYNYLYHGVDETNTANYTKAKNNFFDEYELFQILAKFFRLKNNIIVK